MEYNFELYVIMTVQPSSKCSFSSPHRTNRGQGLERQRSIIAQSNERMTDELQQSNIAHRPRGRATAATSGPCLLLLRVRLGSKEIN